MECLDTIAWTDAQSFQARLEGGRPDPERLGGASTAMDSAAGSFDRGCSGTDGDGVAGPHAGVEGARGGAGKADAAVRRPPPGHDALVEADVRAGEPPGEGHLRVVERRFPHATLVGDHVFPARRGEPFP